MARARRLCGVTWADGGLDGALIHAKGGGGSLNTNTPEQFFWGKKDEFPTFKAI